MCQPSWCRWRWKKGPKERWSGYFSLCPFPSWKGVFSQNGPQRSRARRCCAAKRTLHGEDRSEILDKRERGGPKWTAKMAQSLTASDIYNLAHAGGPLAVVAKIVFTKVRRSRRVIWPRPWRRTNRCPPQKHALAERAVYLVFDLQAKLNSSWPAGICHSTKAASKGPRASGTADGLKWGGKIGGKSARCRIDVPVEYVGERSAEVDVSLFTNDPCPLAKGKFFVPAAEGSSTGKGSRFIAKGERSCNGE